MTDAFDPNGILQDLGNDELASGSSDTNMRRGMSYMADLASERHLQSIARRAGLATFAAPGMAQASPELIAALSSDPNMSDTDLLGLMMGTENTIDLDTYSGNLTAQLTVARNSEEAFDIWQSIPTEMQQLLKNNPEFQVPQPPPESGIFGTNLIRRLGGMLTPGSDWGAGDRGNDFGKGTRLGELSQTTADAVAKPFQFAGSTIMKGFDLLDYPAKQVQRAIRTGDHLNIPFNPASLGGIVKTVKDGAGLDRQAFSDNRSESDRFNRLFVLEEGESVFSNWGGLKRIATEVKASWDASSDPEMTYSLSSLDRLGNAVAGDPFKVEVAKMLASGKDIMTVVEEMTGAERGTPEFAEAFASVYELQGDEQFSSAVSELSKGRITAGGSIFESVTGGLVDKNSTFGKIYSGGAEMGIYMAIDPTIVGGKIRSVQKLARWGVDTGQMSVELHRLHELAKISREVDAGVDVAQLADRIAKADSIANSTIRESRIAAAMLSDAKRVEAGARVDRAFERIARVYDRSDTAYNEAQLLDEMPHLAPLLPALNRVDAADGIRSADDVWEAVRTNQSVRTMLNSSGAGRDPRIFQLPHVSKTGQKWMEAKAGWNETIRWSSGNAAKYDELVTEASRAFRASELNNVEYLEARRLAEVARWDGVSRLGQMRQQTVDSLKQTAHALTTHIPRENNVLSVAADGAKAEDLAANASALNDFKRYTGFARKLGLPQEVVDDYVNLFARGNEGDRNVLVRLFTGELLSASGGMNPRMRQLYDDYVELGNKIYSGGAMEVGKPWTKSEMLKNSATFAGETSKAIKIPSFDEISKAVWRTDTVRSIAGHPVDYLDVMMNRVWKPMVLMRVGFIARAAGEETISFMLRLGPTTLLKSYLAKTALDMRINALTGEREIASELGAIENTVNGLAYRMAGWAKIRNSDIMERSIDLVSKQDQSTLTRLRGLLEDRLRVDDMDGAQILQDKMNAITDAAQQLYVDEKLKGRWTNHVYQLHEWAQARAMEQSPGYFAWMRNSRIGGKIPTKAELARMMLGVDKEFMESARLGRIHFGQTRRWAHPNGKEFSSAEHLIAAHYAMMTNPTTSRLMAKDVASTIGPAYQAGRDDRVGIAQSMSQSSWMETSIVDGKLTQVRMKPLGGQWEMLNDDSPQMKQAFGDAANRMWTDPIVNQSGVGNLLASHVGADTVKEVYRRLGRSGLADIDEVRGYLSHVIRDPDVQVLRNLLAGTETPTPDQIQRVIDGMRLTPYDIKMSDKRIAEVITETADMKRLRGKLFPESAPTSLRTGELDQMRDEAFKIMDEYSRRVGYQPTQAQMAKASTVLGMPIIAPRPSGMTDLYAPLLDSRMVDDFAKMLFTEPGVAESMIEESLFALEKAGYPMSDLEEVGQRMKAALSKPFKSEDGASNILGLAFTDPKHADVVSKVMGDHVNRSNLFAEFKNVSRGTDVANPDPETLRKMFVDVGNGTGVGKLTLEASEIDDPRFMVQAMGNSTGTYLAPGKRFELLDPEQRGIYIELSDGRMVDRADFFNNPEVYEGLSWTGNTEWVNGATNEMALRALNDDRVDAIFKMMTASGEVTGSTDEVFTEVLDALRHGVFDPKYHPGLVDAVELGPQWAPVFTSQTSGKGDMFNRLVQGWFQGVVDPMMSRIIRTPHFAVNMASALPFAEDMYHFKTASMGNRADVTEDVLDSIHALWFTDDIDMLESGDEMAEAILAMRDNTLYKNKRLQDVIGIHIEGKGAKAEGLALKNWAHNRAVAYAESVETASIRAVDLTVEFIDDHRFRSQFQQTVRQVIPFWFAEEQFLKRQVRMLAQTPAAIRKASLFMDGMRHTGMITTDADGNEIFAYPATEAVNRFVLDKTGMVFGFEGMGAFAQPMSTNVDFMFPGLSPTKMASNPFSAVTPNANPSPIVGIPLTMMTNRFPELGFVESALLGNRAGQDPMTQLMPATVARVMSAAGVGSYGADRLASAQMRAMQALDIAGLDPLSMAQARAQATGEDLVQPTTHELQAYADRVRNWARVLNVVDATMYATAPLPSGAGVQFTDLELNKEFQQVMFESGLDRNEAFAMFIERHPDYGVWQVYSSDNVTGASIPQTEEGLRFLTDNADLLADYPHAAAWLAPPFESNSDDEWSRRAHDQLYAAGLRDALAPEEYLEEIYIREALPEYYSTIEQAEVEIFMASKRGDEELADRLETDLAGWKEAYKEMNPIFAASLDDNLQRSNDRKAQRDAILALPREALPIGENVDQVLNLMTSFAQFEREISALADQNTNAVNDQRIAMRNSFYAWAQEYVKENPGARTYWQNVIQHDRIIGGYVTEYTYEYGS